MRKNESGLTLVELLATIVLVSMVVLLILTTFFIFFNYNITETKKLHLQREANLIISHIQGKHRDVECYELEIRENEITINNCVDDDEPFHEIVSTGYTYAPIISREVFPKKADLQLDFSIKDIEKPRLEIEVPTTISRFIYKQ